MFSQSEPSDIECDAPPYTVVRACDGLGFRHPVDVRWCRMSRFQHERRHSGAASFWNLIFWARPKTPTCSCRQPLPQLEKFTFTFASERQADYLIGQCPRCATMFWEEA